MTLKLSLPRFAKTCVDQCRCLLSMLNRARSKPFFLEHLQHLLLKEQLTLIDASRVFMRMNSVYKQASIERHQIKKKATKENTAKQQEQQMLDNPLMKGRNIEVLFL